VAYQLHLQLDDDLEGDLRAFADAWKLSIAAATRVLLQQALATAPRPASTQDKP
jgi:plasmid stability protein